MNASWKVCSCICTKYLVASPFAQITSSVWSDIKDNPHVALLRCYGSEVALKEALSSPVLLYLVPLIFLLTDFLWVSGQASLLTSQAYATVMKMKKYDCLKFFTFCVMKKFHFLSWIVVINKLVDNNQRWLQDDYFPSQ